MALSLDDIVEQRHPIVCNDAPIEYFPTPLVADAAEPCAFGWIFKKPS